MMVLMEESNASETPKKETKEEDGGAMNGW